MPELPEVEVARRALVRWFDGRHAVKAEAEPKARTFRDAKPSDFERLTGTLERAERRGKYLLLSFSGGRGAVAHLGMTGKFVKRPKGQVEKYSKARWVLDTGEVIHFRDPRLFGRIEPMPSSKLFESAPVAALGPDLLITPVTPKLIKDALIKSKQDLKVALMDQGRLAGLGNIHAAEALFRAKLHPGRKANSLNDDEWKRLADGIKAALQYALDHEDGDEIQYVEEPGSENPFFIYGREGTPCSKCKTTVKAFTQGGRTTHFCPSCQPAGATPKAKR